MKKLIYLPFFLLMYSCSKPSDDAQLQEMMNEAQQQNQEENQVANIIDVQATLLGYTNIPTNSSPATGTLAGKLNPNNNTFSFEVSYDSMAPTVAHIHKGRYPNTGPVVYTIPMNGNGYFAGEFTLTKEEADLLLRDEYYVDIHSVMFPDGEIRGQIGKRFR